MGTGLNLVQALTSALPTMIDSCTPLSHPPKVLLGEQFGASQIQWNEAWCSAAGKGLVLGLLDTQFDDQCQDLCGADIRVRDFARSSESSSELRQHGTYSVTTLVGQGHSLIKGIAPRVRLLAGTVVSPNGTANPFAIVQAIRWLANEGAMLIAMPLGGVTDSSEVKNEIRRRSNEGIVFFAARGWFKRALFPAQERSTIAVVANIPEMLRSDDKPLTRVDLVAPGWNIPAAVSAYKIARKSGSSVACVIAVGAAALAISSASLVPSDVNRLSVLKALRGNSRGGNFRNP